MVCPRRRAMSKPAPSLPLFGSERPPVARTMRVAGRSPVLVVMRKPSGVCATSETRAPVRIVTPVRDASSTSAFRTSRARFESGNSLPPASSCRRTPISRKNATVWSTGKPRSTRRMTGRRPPQKSASVTAVLVTLQRAPPLTRIFAPRWLAPSSSTTVRCGCNRLVKIAVARPAAPAPTIATSREFVSPWPRSGEEGGSGVRPELCRRDRAARVAPQCALRRVVRRADYFGSMAPAFWTNRRSFRPLDSLSSVVVS